MFKYLVIIEKADGNFSAYSPDLPGCVATGTTIKETLSRMKDAIQFHIKGLNREGLAIPEPSAKIKYVEISI
ncbi:MAG: type II toxin-antitoxin system HicB family antitoxin [Candidatus Aminicenantes bacterium]|nr:type II toxin-antitoxin system HicB family antitoxin [Candidatus Aminicenantes bacterium]